MNELPTERMARVKRELEQARLRVLKQQQAAVKRINAEYGWGPRPVIPRGWHSAGFLGDLLRVGHAKIAGVRGGAMVHTKDKQGRLSYKVKTHWGHVKVIRSLTALDKSRQTKPAFKYKVAWCKEPSPQEDKSPDVDPTPEFP